MVRTLGGSCVSFGDAVSLVQWLTSVAQDDTLDEAAICNAVERTRSHGVIVPECARVAIAELLDALSYRRAWTRGGEAT